MSGDYQTARRMALKAQALPPLDFSGKDVLDVGCDHGFWSFTAARAGARCVVGLDRGRMVRGQGFVDLVAQNKATAAADPALQGCDFRRIDLGKQWHSFGWFDLILVMSVYHHVYQQCANHHAIWFWLHHHCNMEGEVIFEGPTDDSDPVVRANVEAANQAQFNADAILAAAQEYFEVEYHGPALHEPTRSVYRCVAKPRQVKLTDAHMIDGAGGASKAFECHGGRRMAEIETIFGFRPVPGTLNLRLSGPFDWDRGYFRAQIFDAVDRAVGFDGEWAPRWMRFYPLKIDGLYAIALRFEGEKYDTRFMEVIAPERLRDRLVGPRVRIER